MEFEVFCFMHKLTCFSLGIKRSEGQVELPTRLPGFTFYQRRRFRGTVAGSFTTFCEVLESFHLSTTDQFLPRNTWASCKVYKRVDFGDSRICLHSRP